MCLCATECVYESTRQKCAGARCCFSIVQEWSAPQCKHETGASFVGPDVRRRRAWLVCLEFLCLCAIFVCVHIFVCVPSGKIAEMLRVREACCNVACGDGAPVEARCSGHAFSGRALMCHVMGAGCCSYQYAPPRALSNVRECGTVPTETVVYVPTPYIPLYHNCSDLFCVAGSGGLF